MKRRASVFAFLLALSVGCTALHQPAVATAAAPASQAESSTAAKAALSQVLADAVARGDAPAVVGLVVDRNGVLFEGAGGKMSPSRPDAVQLNAIFTIASMTKPVTSVAIMMLLEQHKLGLDDPVSKY